MIHSRSILHSERERESPSAFVLTERGTALTLSRSQRLIYRSRSLQQRSRIYLHVRFRDRTRTLLALSGFLGAALLASAISQQQQQQHNNTPFLSRFGFFTKTVAQPTARR